MVGQLSEEKTKTLSDYWEAGSRDDIDSAMAIFSKAERYTAALFFLRFAAEKKLKAAFVRRHRTHAPFTHNLLVLIENLGWEATSDTLTLAAEINEFNTESRYPDQKLEFHKKATREFAQDYLAKGKDFLLWIGQKSQSAS
ncbi:MAG: hypothetical protein RI953_867 [Pseudomonadota bacterium]|jgi:HEPN domain-containing protein